MGPIVTFYLLFFKITNISSYICPKCFIHVATTEIVVFSSIIFSKWLVLCMKDIYFYIKLFFFCFWFLLISILYSTNCHFFFWTFVICFVPSYYEHTLLNFFNSWENVWSEFSYVYGKLFFLLNVSYLPFVFLPCLWLFVCAYVYHLSLNSILFYSC